MAEKLEKGINKVRREIALKEGVRCTIEDLYLYIMDLNGDSSMKLYECDDDGIFEAVLDFESLKNNPTAKYLALGINYDTYLHEDELSHDILTFRID